jgi:hypothetical protein
MMAYTYEITKVHLGSLSEDVAYVAGVSYIATCTDARGTATHNGRATFSPLAAKSRTIDPRYGVVAPEYDPSNPESFYVDLLTSLVDEAALAVMIDLAFNKDESERIAESYRVRDKRDELLLETDWTQLPDVPDTIKQSWAQYRQELRDIPAQSGFPYNVNWPTKP